MITGGYTITPFLTGDIDFQDSFSSEESDVSPGQSQIIDLAMGNNTITVPTGGDSIAVAVMIIPPLDNAIVLTLKGVGGDTGISLHLTNPSIVSLNEVSSIVLNAATALEGLRLIFI